MHHSEELSNISVPLLSPKNIFGIIAGDPRLRSSILDFLGCKYSDLAIAATLRNQDQLTINHDGRLQRLGHGYQQVSIPKDNLGGYISADPDSSRVINIANQWVARVLRSALPNIRSVGVSPFATGCEPGTSPHKNAQIHFASNNDIYQNFDLKNAFSSITIDFIYTSLKTDYQIAIKEKYPDLDSEQIEYFFQALVILFSAKGSLPQGSPVGATVFNKLMEPLHWSLIHYLVRLGLKDVILTAFVDDITISYKRNPKIVALVGEINDQLNFVLNPDLGLLNSDKPKLLQTAIASADQLTVFNLRSEKDQLLNQFQAISTEYIIDPAIIQDTTNRLNSLQVITEQIQFHVQAIIEGYGLKVNQNKLKTFCNEGPQYPTVTGYMRVPEANSYRIILAEKTLRKIRQELKKYANFAYDPTQVPRKFLIGTKIDAGKMLTDLDEIRRKLVQSFGSNWEPEMRLLYQQARQVAINYLPADPEDLPTYRTERYTVATY